MGVSETTNMDATWINAKCSICDKPTVKDGLIVCEDDVMWMSSVEVNHVACVDEKRNLDPTPMC